MADLDHFKLLNETYGHEAGDRALRLFTDTVRRAWYTLPKGKLALGEENWSVYQFSLSTLGRITRTDQVSPAAGELTYEVVVAVTR